ncbi:MAG: tyrosine-type recombinase/integrase [Gammaproteobacteria bacterium]|nr:tyrosine-type recombinase/integrase [Gammaproteobacteria bacterium]
MFCQLLATRAPTTQRSYLREISAWLDWCETSGICPLPASVASVGLYLSFRLVNATSKSAVELSQAAISWLHDIFGVFPNPAKSSFCRSFPESARRSVVATSRQKAALPLADLHRMLARLLRPPAEGRVSALHLRTAALAALLFHGFLRISEALAIRYCDIEWEKCHVTINVLNSKGNCYRENRKVPIATLNSIYCPVAILDRYIQAIAMSRYDRGTPVFARLHRTASGYFPLSQPLSYSSARSLISKAFMLVGLDPKKYCTHSFRSGGASCALSQGFPVERVMRHGRWATYSAFSRYWEESTESRARVSRLI